MTLFDWQLVDLGVYRRGGHAVATGTSFTHIAGGLPFTYPPFAAVAFVPLSGIPNVVGDLTFTILSVASCAIFVTILATKLGLSSELVKICVVVGFSFEAVIHTLKLGQVNLILAAMIVLDAFYLNGRTSKYRGLLTGMAAGIKIVPGVFLLYYLVRRDWHSALRVAAGFSLTVAVGLVADRTDSENFWGHDFYSADHVGGVAYVSNQSLLGVIVRLSKNEHPNSILVHTLQMAALLLATFAAKRQLGFGCEVGALVSIAFGGLLASPISWSHHWVWLVPGALILVCQGRIYVASAVSLVAYIAPEWYTPSENLREFHHNLWQQLLCSTTCCVGLIFLGFMVAGPVKATRNRNRFWPSEVSSGPFTL